MRILSKTDQISQIIWVAVVGFGLSGCSTRVVTLVHPVSGASAKCSASGAGLGTVWAESFIDNCIERYKDMGYLPLDELTPEQRDALQKQGSLPANQP